MELQQHRSKQQDPELRIRSPLPHGAVLSTLRSPAATASAGECVGSAVQRFVSRPAQSSHPPGARGPQCGTSAPRRPNRVLSLALARAQMLSAAVALQQERPATQRWRSTASAVRAKQGEVRARRRSPARSHAAWEKPASTPRIQERRGKLSFAEVGFPQANPAKAAVAVAKERHACSHVPT